MKILNIKNLNTGDRSDIQAFCRHRIAENRGAFLIPMNPIKVIKARSSLDFQDIIDYADWVFPEAWGIKWAASFLFQQKIPLTPGYSLMLALLEQAEKDGHPVYLLGTTDNHLGVAVTEIKRRWPRLRICGSHNGFFLESEENGIVESIAALKPRYIFVGMGEYKQEKAITRIRNVHPGAIYLGVGGTIDLLANKQPSPPPWIRRHHIEWLFRLWRQPFRLPRFKALPIFAFLTIIEKVKMMIH
jgi:N-acetylglucosaminyldiphosphoundecaprenol N-acetyl-beta-D-mannosaminyltransferase